ncbi:MAG: hypothetical protein OEY33_02695 [Bdellovibrionales bacterium]|nr:hypothetical protein [Bdellovibrionales bacterium]
MANQNLKIKWLKKIDSWKASDLSQREFCRRERISPHQFSYWRRKLKTYGNPSEKDLFIPIKTSSDFIISLGDTTISFKNEPNPK